MVDIQSKEVIDKISDDLKIQPSMTIPRELGKIIMPVFVVNSERGGQIVESFTSTTTGPSTIFTTPTDRDFFLQSAFLSIDDDVTSNGLAANLTITPFAQGATNIIRLHKLTLTATSKELSNFYGERGIRLARGSTVVITHIFTAGASTLSGGITGYVTDPE